MLQLPPDETFYAQILLFLLFAIALAKLIWEPTLHVLEEREKRTHGAEEDARRMRDEAAGMQKKLEASIEEARLSGSDAGEGLRREAEAEERRQLDAAHAEAAALLDDVRRRVAAEAEQARAELRGQADSLARAAAEKILGRAVAS